MLLSTLIVSLPAVVNVGALLCLLFFVYAYMGEPAAAALLPLRCCRCAAAAVSVGHSGTTVRCLVLSPAHSRLLTSPVYTPPPAQQACCCLATSCGRAT